MSRAERKKELIQAAVFVLPTLAVLLVFTLFPVVYAFYLSLNKVNLVGNVSYQFVGFQNFINAFNDSRVAEALWNTAKYVLVVVPIQTVLALILATVLNSGIKFQKTFRSLLFIPTLTSSSALTLIFMFIFSLNGPINSLLMDLHVYTQPINFLNDQSTVLYAIMAMNIWSTVPMFMTIYLSGLQDIDSAMYEAADIDGANMFQKWFKITIPQIAPVTNYVVMMGLISTFQLFDQPYIVSQGSGGPNNSTLTLSLIIYQYAFRQFGTMGYASAIAILLTIVIFIISMVFRRFSSEDITGEGR